MNSVSKCYLVLVWAGVWLFGFLSSKSNAITLSSTGCRGSLLNSNQWTGVIGSSVAVAFPVSNTVEKKAV